MIYEFNNIYKHGELGAAVDNLYMQQLLYISQVIYGNNIELNCRGYV